MKYFELNKSTGIVEMNTFINSLDFLTNKRGVNESKNKVLSCCSGT
ncbi:hypothetical protein THF1C08_30012 [Vibrio jasicida]|uniref:Uncharacterized protein n=1 Tax=Vibrio jasicida TaxID=766224 RepID=A0AAU9QVB6_9VIBR|nr:hypothetical protein THF1C08_30012 [Vibrio jasicida]CAH1600115.1 hypothetical protein THF1A12_40422 [Vibrio jasicida]